MAPVFLSQLFFRAVITLDNHGTRSGPPAVARSSVFAVCVLNRTLVFVEDKSSENLLTGG